MGKHLFLYSIVIIFILIISGCAKSTSNTNSGTDTDKPVTSKKSQDIVNDFKGALEDVFGGEVKLTSNQNLHGMLTYSFSISRFPTDADALALVRVFSDLGYKKADLETTDEPNVGRATNISFSGSSYYLSVGYYNDTKQINLVLMSAEEAKKL